MRDVRFFIDMLSSVEIESALILHVLRPSTVVSSLSCPAWRAFTSVTRRTSFSSAVAILAVRVGGFRPRWRDFGGGGGGGGGGLGEGELGCGLSGGREVVAVVDGHARVN